MSDPTIICPKCHSEIKLTESLAATFLESTKKAYEKRLSEVEERIQKREATLREQESALRASKEQLEKELAKRIQESREQIAEEESKKARQALSLDLDQKTREVAELNEVLKARDEKLAEAQKTQADLLRKQRELEDAQRELDLTVEKRDQESVTQVREQAKKEAEDGIKMKVGEYNIPLTKGNHPALASLTLSWISKAHHQLVWHVVMIGSSNTPSSISGGQS